MNPARLREGRPWASRLPFPVHVVDEVETLDEISGGRLVQRYAYRHGHWDAHFREFRGFARVDQWDGEHFDVGEHAESELAAPPVRMVTFFDVGCSMIRKAVREEYWSHPELDVAPLEREVRSDAEELWRLDSWGYTRAPKGSPLRQEVYAEDGSAQEGMPYTVEDWSYVVRHLQPVRRLKGVDRADSLCWAPSVWHVIPETHRTVHLERSVEAPRTSWDVTLAWDAYGMATSQISLWPGLGEGTLDEQERSWAGLVETSWIHVPAGGDGAWRRVGVEATQAQWNVVNADALLSSVIEDGVLDVAALRASLLDGGGPDRHGPSVEPEGASPALVLQGAILTRYLPEEVRVEEPPSSGEWEPAAPLALGQVASHGLPAEVLALAFDDETLEHGYGSTDSQSEAYTWVRPEFAAVVTPTLAEQGYEVEPAFAPEFGIDGGLEGDIWLRSGRVLHDPDLFLLPVRMWDRHGGESEVTYGESGLTVTKLTDRLGLETEVEWDHRMMSPSQVTDANGSRVAARQDALGHVVLVAELGREGESEGDTVEEPTMRFTVELDRWRDEGKPNRVIREHKETYGLAWSHVDARAQASWAYWDGFGRALSVRMRTRPEDGEPPTERWVSSGHVVYDTRGRVVRAYEPYFALTEEHEFDVGAQGVSPVFRHDPLNRPIRVEHPDGTAEEVRFSPWHVEYWDAGDLVLESEWYSERTQLDPGDPAYRAAQLSAAYAETPAEELLDGRGQVVGSVRRYRDVTWEAGTGETEADRPVLSHVVVHRHDGAGRVVEVEEWPEGEEEGSRVLAEARWDVVGRAMRHWSADAGMGWMWLAQSGPVSTGHHSVNRSNCAESGSIRPPAALTSSSVLRGGGAGWAGGGGPSRPGRAGARRPCRPERGGCPSTRRPRR